jgi:hypothetical protein
MLRELGGWGRQLTDLVPVRWWRLGASGSDALVIAPLGPLTAEMESVAVSLRCGRPVVRTEGDTLNDWYLDSIAPDQISLSGPAGTRTPEPRADPALARPTPAVKPRAERVARIGRQASYRAAPAPSVKSGTDPRPPSPENASRGSPEAASPQQIPGSAERNRAPNAKFASTRTPRP